MIPRKIEHALYPLLGVALILVAWQLYTWAFQVNRIVLPSPTDIYHASVANWRTLLIESWPTFLESLLGFALAVVIGIPIAVCVANSRILNLTLYPILIATQSVPKVAIAPIVLIWFGLGMQSKLVIAFLGCVLPDGDRYRSRYAGDAAGPSRTRALAQGITFPDLHEGAVSRGAAVRVRRCQGCRYSCGNRRGDWRVRRLGRRPW